MINLSVFDKVYLNKNASWFRSPRLYIGLIFGIVFSAYYTINYIRFAIFINEPINILEPFIILGTNKVYFSVIFLCLMLILSDAPFITPRSLFVIIRIGRKKWINTCIKYICFVSFAYYLIILLTTSFISLGHCYISNIWSHPMYIISQLQPSSVYEQYNVYFSFNQIPKEMLPLRAVIYIFMLSILHGIFFSLLTYLLNLRFNKIIGLFSLLCIHLIGFILISDNLIYESKYLPLSNALLGYHNFGSGTSKLTILFSVFFFIALISIMLLFLIYTKKTIESNLYEHKTNWRRK